MQGKLLFMNTKIGVCLPQKMCCLRNHEEKLRIDELESGVDKYVFENEFKRVEARRRENGREERRRVTGKKGRRVTGKKGKN